MRTKPTVVVAALAATCVFAAVSIDDLAKAHIKSMHDDGSITNVLNTLVTDGTFCKVRGHKWGFCVSVVEVYDERPSRQCSVCGITQRRSLSDWE